jgi:hypothetical protein
VVEENTARKKDPMIKIQVVVVVENTARKKYLMIKIQSPV